jgi:hypothetical protein
MARRQVQQAGGLVPRVEWRVRPDSEAGVLTQASRSRLEGNARLIGNGGSATYSFRVLGGMDIAIRLTVSGEGQVRVRTQGGGLTARAFRGGIQQLNLTTRAPLNPPVQMLQVIVETKRRTQARVYELQLVASDRDEDRDGIGDGVERLLGAPANALRPTLPPTPRSGYQTGADYSPRLDLATDAVILHSFDPARLANWKTRSYPIIVMGGFRDYQPYAEADPDAVQRTRNGAPMSIESSFYLVPTPERIEALIRQYLQMLEAGADAICPEEPEYWADAGYEVAFRQLYEARLGHPWQPPDASHAARWTADRFKAQLMTEAVHAILNAVRAHKPTAKRMVAVHSPLNYALWRICLAHYALIFGDGFPDLPPSVRFPPLREGNQAGPGSHTLREGNRAGAGSHTLREGNRAGENAVPPASRGNHKEGVSTSQHIILFLRLWLLIALAAAVWGVPFQAMRHLLYALPPLILILTPWAGRNAPLLIAQGVLCLAVIAADYDYAVRYKRGAAAYAEQFAGERVWYAGSWGWMFYAEQHGFRKLLPDGKGLQRGDIVIIPERVYKGKMPPDLHKHLILLDETPCYPLMPLRTMDFRGAAYYALIRTNAPFRFTLQWDEPLEIRRAYRWMPPR